MERAAVPESTPASGGFRDGLGERRHLDSPTGNEALEQLCLRNELAAVPSFEFALRERVSHLASFRHPQFGRADRYFTAVQIPGDGAGRHEVREPRDFARH